MDWQVVANKHGFDKHSAWGRFHPESMTFLIELRNFDKSRFKYGVIHAI